MFEMIVMWLLANWEKAIVAALSIVFTTVVVPIFVYSWKKRIDRKDDLRASYEANLPVAHRALDVLIDECFPRPNFPDECLEDVLYPGFFSVIETKLENYINSHLTTLGRAGVLRVLRERKRLAFNQVLLYNERLAYGFSPSPDSELTREEQDAGKEIYNGLIDSRATLEQLVHQSQDPSPFGWTWRSIRQSQGWEAVIRKFRGWNRKIRRWWN